MKANISGAASSWCLLRNKNSARTSFVAAAAACLGVHISFSFNAEFIASTKSFYVSKLSAPVFDVERIPFQAALSLDFIRHLTLKCGIKGPTSSVFLSRFLCVKTNKFPFELNGDGTQMNCVTAQSRRRREMFSLDQWGGTLEWHWLIMGRVT